MRTMKLSRDDLKTKKESKTFKKNLGLDNFTKILHLQKICFSILNKKLGSFLEVGVGWGPGVMGNISPPPPFFLRNKIWTFTFQDI